MVNHKTLSQCETNRVTESELIAQIQTKQRRSVLRD